MCNCLCKTCPHKIECNLCLICNTRESFGMSPYEIKDCLLNKKTKNIRDDSRRCSDGH